MDGQAQTETPGRQSQSRTLNHSNWRRRNQTGSHSPSAVQIHIFTCFPTSSHSTTFSLQISLVVKTTSFTVLRKSIITPTKAFHWKSESSPRWKGVLLCPRLRDDTDHSCIYTGNPSFCTCYFFPDDCAKSLPSGSLNPVFTEKAQSFHLVLFIIPSNLLSPLTCYLIQCADVRLSPRVMCFSSFFWSWLIVPLARKPSLINNLRLITMVHMVLAHFLFLTVFVEGFSNTHSYIYISLLNINFSTCVWARLGTCWLPRSYLPPR